MRLAASLSVAVFALVSLSLSSQISAYAQAAPEAQSATSQVAHVALTPPMGWNSWNFFAGKVTDKDIRDTADLLVSTGMRDASYVYVNIDDNWEGERDASAGLQTNSRFPDVKPLADYVHSMGLNLVIYYAP